MIIGEEVYTIPTNKIYVIDLNRRRRSEVLTINVNYQ